MPRLPRLGKGGFEHVQVWTSADWLFEVTVLIFFHPATENKGS